MPINESYPSLFEYYDYLIKTYQYHLSDYSQWIDSDRVDDKYMSDRNAYYKIPFNTHDAGGNPNPESEWVWVTKEQLAISLLLKEALIHQYDRFPDKSKLIFTDTIWYNESGDEYRTFCFGLHKWSGSAYEIATNIGISTEDANKAMWVGSPASNPIFYGDYTGGLAYPIPYIWAKSYVTQENRFEGLRVVFEERSFEREEDSPAIPDFVTNGRKNLEVWYKPIQRYYLYHNTGQRYGNWSRKLNMRYSNCPAGGVGGSYSLAIHSNPTQCQVNWAETGQWDTDLCGSFPLTGVCYPFDWRSLLSIDTQDYLTSPTFRDPNDNMIILAVPFLGAWYEEDPFNPTDLVKLCNPATTDLDNVKNESVNEIWVRAYLVDTEGNEYTFDTSLDSSPGIQNREYMYDDIILALRAINDKIVSDGTFTYNLIYYGGRGE